MSINFTLNGRNIYINGQNLSIDFVVIYIIIPQYIITVKCKYKYIVVVIVQKTTINCINTHIYCVMAVKTKADFKLKSAFAQL